MGKKKDKKVVSVLLYGQKEHFDFMNFPYAEDEGERIGRLD